VAAATERPGVRAAGMREKKVNDLARSNESLICLGHASPIINDFQVEFSGPAESAAPASHCTPLRAL
jgi:hypothetical protein